MALQLLNRCTSKRCFRFHKSKSPMSCFSPLQSQRIRCLSGAPLTQLSDEEQMLKESVARYAKEKVAPRMREYEAKRRIPDDMLSDLFANGWMSVQIPIEYGGTGASFFSTALVIEEFAKVDPTLAALIDLQNTLVSTVLTDYGNEQQKKKYLSKLSTSSRASTDYYDAISSDCIRSKYCTLPLVADETGCFCLSEQGSGSDAFALETRAVRDGDHYVINGNKLWITNADRAEVVLVMANAAPDKGYKGITCFVVDADTPGLSVPRKEEKLGQLAASNCPVTFDNVRVPAKNMVGEIGLGYKITMNVLNEGRIGIAAQMLGAAEGVLDYVVPYTLERKQFGKRLFDFQAMQHQIAEASTNVMAARLLVYNAARLRDQKKDFVKEASMAKYFTTELACQVSYQGIKWLGGIGYMKDAPIEKFLRDTIPGVIYEGTSNVQLNTIAHHISKEYR